MPPFTIVYHDLTSSDSLNNVDPDNAAKWIVGRDPGIRMVSAASMEVHKALEAHLFVIYIDSTAIIDIGSFWAKLAKANIPSIIVPNSISDDVSVLRELCEYQIRQHNIRGSMFIDLAYWNWRTLSMIIKAFRASADVERSA